jgi:hypothetical protein
MELVLNLAWIVLATLMYWLWIRYGPRDGADRRTQLIALALVVLILFPVISVTDDLMAAQSVAETDSGQRKVHGFAIPHATPHPVAQLILPIFAELSCVSVYFAAPGNPLAPTVKIPALESIQNRPPPAA